jgi:hypothetical protein
MQQYHLRMWEDHRICGVAETLSRYSISQTKPSRLLGLVAAGFNAVVLVISIGALRYPSSVYLRNALFATTVDDTQIRTEDNLNQFLQQRRRLEPPDLEVRNLFTSSELRSMDAMKASSSHASCRQPTDHPFTRLTPTDCLARALALDVSRFQMGGKCGMDGSIRARIGSVENGIGCCSDYNEAFLLRANAVGLEAREVHNMGHTTAEYFDPSRQRWTWIDTSHRVQIAEANGDLVSAWSRRNRAPWQSLTFVDLPPLSSSNNFRQPGPSPFTGTNNAILYWTNGINLLEQERFEEPLRRVGLPREAVQLVSLLLGVRPGWTVLAPPEAAFRLRLSAWLLRISIVAVIMMNALLIPAALGWRIRRRTP